MPFQEKKNPSLPNATCLHSVTLLVMNHSRSPDVSKHAFIMALSETKKMLLSEWMAQHLAGADVQSFILFENNFKNPLLDHDKFNFYTIFLIDDF